MMSVCESLQEFAARKRMRIDQAYSLWHTVGNVIAEEWQQPAKMLNSTTGDEHVTIAGGRCLGLTAIDIRNIMRAS